MKINLQEKLMQIFAIGAFLMINVGWAQVTLPHYDGFDYTVGSSLQAQSTWTQLNTSGTGDILATSGNLVNTNLPSSTGSKITFDGGGIDATKAFTAQAVGTGATVYYSYLMTVTALGSLNTTGGYFTGIKDSNASGFASTLWLRNDGAGYNIGYGARVTSANVVWTPGIRALGTTFLIVVSNQSVAGNANDIAKIWINPVLNGSEPSPTASITNAGTDLTFGMQQIFIRQDSGTVTPFIEMDELRIGLTFESVTSNVWNGSTWTNGTPTVTTNALVNGAYDTTTSGTITTKNLIIEGSGALQVNSGTGITVNDNINNKLTADKFVVQSNGNIDQEGTTNGNIGAITVNRNSTPMIRLDYTFWSSPVAGQNLLGFSPLTSVTPTVRFYDYDESANDFTNIGLPNNFVTGKGYSVRAPNTFDSTPTSFAGFFVGIPNNGTITVPVFNTGAPKGYNIIGNPYASPIDAALFMSGNVNVTALYFWTHTLQGAATSANYATYNGTGTVAAAGGTIPNGIIQTGQGFIAKVVAGPEVTFTNDMRIANYVNQFFRTSSTNVTSSEADKNRIWLNLSHSNSVINQTLVGYVPNASNAIDNAFDATLLDNIGSRLYSVINNEAYVIQGRALPFSGADTVALGFKTDVAGNYSISIAQLDGLFAGNQNVFLLDNLTGTTHNIKQAPYNFASAIGTFNARFSLVYQNVLSTQNPNFDANSVVVFTKNNSININTALTSMQNVQLFDLRGSLIAEKNNVNATATSINDLNISKGVLIVKITSTDGKTISKKVVF